MADRSNISWTDATWNVVTGCSRVSEGCRHCFAEAVSHRYGWTTKPWTAQNAADNVRLHEDRLDWPLKWRKPRRIFTVSMGDLFHEQIPAAFIAQVFGIMARADQHTFQVLTKRPERMARLLNGEVARIADEIGGCPWPLPNVWLGTSVERQREADERIPHLLACPAAVRFLSCEPMLGSISLERWLADYDSVWGEPLCPKASPGLHWVIVGGESGPGFRPMELDWARDLRDECQSCDVAFWFKQHAGIRPGMNHMLDGQVWQQFPRTEVPA